MKLQGIEKDYARPGSCDAATAGMLIYDVNYGYRTQNSYCSNGSVSGESVEYCDSASSHDGDLGISLADVEQVINGDAYIPRIDVDQMAEMADMADEMEELSKTIIGNDHNNTSLDMNENFRDSWRSDPGEDNLFRTNIEHQFEPSLPYPDYPPSVCSPSSPSCPSPTSPICNKPSTPRKRTKKVSPTKETLPDFLCQVIKNPDFNPCVVKWLNEEDGVFLIVKPKVIAQLWGERKGNPKMNYPSMSRGIRERRKYGYFARVPQDPRYPKKLTYKFGPMVAQYLKQ